MKYHLRLALLMCVVGFNGSLSFMTSLGDQEGELSLNASQVGINNPQMAEVLNQEMTQEDWSLPIKQRKAKIEKIVRDYKQEARRKREARIRDMQKFREEQDARDWLNDTVTKRYE